MDSPPPWLVHLREIAHLFRTLIIPHAAPWPCGDFLALAEALWSQICPKVAIDPQIVADKWAADAACTIRRMPERRAECVAWTGMIAECEAAARGAMRCAKWLSREYHHECYEARPEVEVAHGRSINYALQTCCYLGVVWLADHFPRCERTTSANFQLKENLYEMFPSYSREQSTMRYLIVDNVSLNANYAWNTFAAAQLRDPPDVAMLNRLLSMGRVRRYSRQELKVAFMRASQSPDSELMKFLALNWDSLETDDYEMGRGFQSSLLIDLCRQGGKLPVIRTLVKLWELGETQKEKLLPALRVCWSLDDLEGVKFFMEAGNFDVEDARELLCDDDDGGDKEIEEADDVDDEMHRAVRLWMLERHPDADQPPKKKKRKK